MFRNFRNLVAIAGIFISTGGLSFAQANFPVSLDTPPVDWSGPKFEPSFNFPSQLPIGERLPWKERNINFRTEPTEYLSAVLEYVFEGMDKATWRVQDNPVRKWYHVPWMHVGGSGREFIYGLTRERSSRAYSLGVAHDTCTQIWAVGFYNSIGGVTLGEVWGDGKRSPNPSKGQFRPGTVVAKLLFTEATVDHLPQLTGAPTIQANIHRGTLQDADGCVTEENPRKETTLRLLQLDIAVRDESADSTTGWVFGTFMYDGTRAGVDGWARLSPVGLMWGNDSDLSDAGAKAGQKPAEGVALSKFGFTRDFGRSGRMNGPVDNPNSACLSCHMTAQFPSEQRSMSGPPWNPDDPKVWEVAKCFFRNLKPSEPFGKAGTLAKPACVSASSQTVSLDYSLQLAMSLRAYFVAHPTEAAALSSATTPGATSVRKIEETGSLVRGPYNFGNVTSYPITR